MVHGSAQQRVLDQVPVDFVHVIITHRYRGGLQTHVATRYSFAGYKMSIGSILRSMRQVLLFWAKRNFASEYQGTAVEENKILSDREGNLLSADIKLENDQIY